MGHDPLPTIVGCGACAWKNWELQARTEVTTTTLWVATIRHNHTEDLSGEFRSCLSRHIQREGRRAGSRAVKMTAPEKHCEQIDVIKRAVKLPRLWNTLRLPNIIIIIQPPPQALRFLHGRGERETSDWWWTARNHGKGLLPTFLCAHICFKREMSGYEADNN